MTANEVEFEDRDDKGGTVINCKTLSFKHVNM